MRIDIMTLFPEMCRSVYSESILGRAVAAGVLRVESVNIRDFAGNRHGKVDDTPYGGGEGMLMQAEPIYACFSSLCAPGDRPYLIYMSPKGRPLTQRRARELAELSHIAILCGHYEGVDQRVIDELVDEEISVGDYVLTGGELPALVLTDCIARMLDGTLSSEAGRTDESHYNGLLEYPQYTKPAEWRGREVPDVLLSGHHANIERWRREYALAETFFRRPDLLNMEQLSEEDWEVIRRFAEERKNR